MKRYTPLFESNFAGAPNVPVLSSENIKEREKYYVYEKEAVRLFFDTSLDKKIRKDKILGISKEIKEKLGKEYYRWYNDFLDSFLKNPRVYKNHPRFKDLFKK